MTLRSEEKMSVCIIVGGGDFSSGLLSEKHEGDLVIAADSGYRYLKEAGIEPDICVGDFDSLGDAPGDCPVKRLPVMKDDTDMIAAARLGLEKGYRDFKFFGVLGGKRFSHSVAAVQTVVWLLEQGAHAKIVDKNCTVTALKNETVEFSAEERGSISVFAHSDSAVISLRGLLYPLEKHLLKNSFPLGVSNSFVGKSAAITVEDGVAILIREA